MRSPTERTRHRGVAAVATLLLASAAAAAPPSAPPSVEPSHESAKASEIDFAESLDVATAIVADRPRPIVIQFGATWCGWCRKLEAETLKDPQVVAMAPRFGWVHADVDKDPELAARYGARALPHAVVIDGTGQVLAESRGFSDAKGYLAFLARGEAAYVPPTNVPIAPEAIPERTRTLVTTMAPASATGRQQCVEAIRRLGPDALPVLVELLGSERLALRAAASFALGELARADLAFDPMASAEVRAARVAEWKAWLATDGAKSLRPAKIGGVGSATTPKGPAKDAPREPSSERPAEVKSPADAPPLRKKIARG